MQRQIEQQMQIQAQKLEHLAFVELNQMANKPGIRSAIVFTGPTPLSTVPNATADAGPQPAKSSVLQAPTIGNVVAFGFNRPVGGDEARIVEARMPWMIATWLHNS